MAQVQKAIFLEKLYRFDYNWFANTVSTELAFVIKNVADLGYNYSITKSKANFQSDPYAKKMQIAITAGLQSVPILGELLKTLNVFGWDFEVFKIISESNSVQSVLWHRKKIIGFALPSVKGTPLEPYLQTIYNQTKSLEGQQPKCSVPTGNCGNEHTHYIRRGKLFNYCNIILFSLPKTIREMNEADFNNYIKELTYTLQTNKTTQQYLNNQGTGSNLTSNGKTAVAGIGIAGALILLATKMGA